MHHRLDSSTVSQRGSDICLPAPRLRARGRVSRAAYCALMLAGLPLAWMGCVGPGGGGEVVYGGGTWFGDGAWVDGGGRGWDGGHDDRGYVHPGGGGHAEAHPAEGGGHAEAHSSGGGGHDHR